MEHLQLAITSIGDLLLRQTISRNCLEQPLTGISLKIPNYQRPYKWSAANSSGSNWSPRVKLDHYYIDKSGKIPLISVASLKFIVMMQKCRDNTENKARNDGQEWDFSDIQAHQQRMVKILLSPQG